VLQQSLFDPLLQHLPLNPVRHTFSGRVLSLAVGRDEHQAFVAYGATLNSVLATTKDGVQDSVHKGERMSTGNHELRVLLEEVQQRLRVA